MRRILIIVALSFPAVAMAGDPCPKGANVGLTDSTVASGAQVATNVGPVADHNSNVKAVEDSIGEH